MGQASVLLLAASEAISNVFLSTDFSTDFFNIILVHKTLLFGMPQINTITNQALKAHTSLVLPFAISQRKENYVQESARHRTLGIYTAASPLVNFNYCRHT